MTRSKQAGRGLAVTVAYDVPADVALDYLADPVHRPEWQSSLRRVRVLDAGPAHTGQRWEDHTAVGLVAQMRTTELEPGRRWAEVGSWRAISAELVLELVPAGAGCEVEAHFRVRGRGALAPIGWLATAAALPAVRADLVRAGRILSEREHP